MPDNFNSNNGGFNIFEQLMGGMGSGSGSESGNNDPMAMMGRMQRLQKLMNSNSNLSKNSNEESNNKIVKDELYAQENRQEQMLYTVLPFIQPPFRNMIFNMTKFLEVQRIMNRREEDVVLNAREKSGANHNSNNTPMDMLQAIKPFLHNNEQQQLDMMVKMMGVTSMFNGFTQEYSEKSGDIVDNSVDNGGGSVDNPADNRG